MPVLYYTHGDLWSFTQNTLAAEIACPSLVGLVQLDGAAVAPTPSWGDAEGGRLCLRVFLPPPKEEVGS